MKPIEITDDKFEVEVTKSDKPVLIDFWAVWCGPSKLMAPIVEELATEYDGKVKIGKMDVDSNQQTSIKFGVLSIPTLLLCGRATGIAGITGEKFAELALLRNAACAGCPVGCIHIGFVRECFQKQNRYLYRQVSYDHEPIFAVGAMLAVENCFEVLAIIDVAEKVGLDVMSAGVALAWATEATEKGLVCERETIVRLGFGDSESYRQAIQHLGEGRNEFYRLLGQGTLKAAARYGGADFACVLGQEMAGEACSCSTSPTPTQHAASRPAHGSSST